MAIGAPASRILHQAAEPEQRQIVDSLVAHILQRLQRRAVAGAGQAGD
jgi:hypothetical protein